MSIYRRGKIWWARFTAPNGKRIFKSTRTEDKKLAQEFHDKLKFDYWRYCQLDERPVYTWQQAVVRWITEQSHKKSLRDDKGHLRKLNSYLCNKTLVQIERVLIDEITLSRLEDGVKDSTVNRMLEVLRAILKRAELQWDWLDRAPHVRMLSEPKRRIRWITREESGRLIRELPEHLADMVVFTLASGLRETNVTRLKWEQVDLQRRVAWIYADQAKAGRDITIPLNNDAIMILQKQISKHDIYVFTYQGRPVLRANNHAWRKALNRAGIENFRFHDLRHTWASWHVQAGTPIHVLQELGGWESVEMVRRYAHLSAGHLAEYAGNVSRSLVLTDTKLKQ